MPDVFTYYRDALTNPAEKAAYDAIWRGLAGFCKSFRAPELPLAVLSDLYAKVRLDFPLIMGSSTFSKQRINGDTCFIIPSYDTEVKKAEENLQAVKVRLTRVLRPAMARGTLEKIRFVHDFILDHVRYDQLKKPYSHEITGPLQNGVGVCEGIAKTCKAMFDELSLESLIVIGEASAPEKSRMRHAWNIVYVNGIPYHFDATFDLTLSVCGLKRHDYELISSDAIRRDHGDVIYPVPECPDGRLNYYASHQLVLTSEAALPAILSKAMKRREKGIVLRIGANADWKNILPAVQSWSEKDPQKTTVHICANPPQRVIAFVFKENQTV